MINRATRTNASSSGDKGHAGNDGHVNAVVQERWVEGKRKLYGGVESWVSARNEDEPANPREVAMCGEES